MEIDRDALYGRLDELTDEFEDMTPDDEVAPDLADEFQGLEFIRDLFYLEDEGFVEIDEEGRVFPIGEAVCLKLPA